MAVKQAGAGMEQPHLHCVDLHSHSQSLLDVREIFEEVVTGDVRSHQRAA